MKIAMDAMLPTWRSVGQRVAGRVNEATALRSFDAYFVGEMLKRADASSGQESSLFDGGPGGRMYQDFLNEELARIVVRSVDFGLARGLEGQLNRSQHGPAEPREKS